MIPSPPFPVKAASAIAVEIFSTSESSAIVLTVATSLYSAVIVPVPLPDLICCLIPEPLPFPSRMVNPPTMSFIASVTGPIWLLEWLPQFVSFQFFFSIV